MRRRWMAVWASLAVMAGCGTGREGSPASTIPGPAQDRAPIPSPRTGDCLALPTAGDLKRLLEAAPGGQDAGGWFGGRAEWAVVVNRQGEICTVAFSSDDPAALWPAGQALAKAKAYTANAFSTDSAPLSSARLYTLVQPGHSMAGIERANPFNPDCVDAPADQGGDEQVCGGVLALGGGVALYRNLRRVGALGVAGDTACADHEIAKRIRDAAGLNPAGGALVDDIQFSSVDGASIYAHPLCPNTWRNGKKLGDEPPGS